MTAELPAPLDLDDLPVPHEAAEAWKKVEAKCRSARLKRAMLLRLNGHTVKESRELAGYEGKDTAEFHRTLKHYGLSSFVNTTARLIAHHREIAILTSEKQIDALRADEKPDAKLAVVGGISTDKVKDYERWSKQDEIGTGLAEALGSVAEGIIKAGGRLEAKLTTDKGEATLTVGKELQDADHLAQGKNPDEPRPMRE